ncbi:MAG: SusC/RagA family TonB-linked outer membrane protein [Bacteroidales bacterium]|nr:SusC/RagA family TonB-linked outer membrane protein [Bacteroidales bacterium]
MAFTAVTANAAASVAASAAQQDGIVTGKIVDHTGEGVIGAGVMVKGTTTGTITDFDGSFELKNVAKGTVLEITCIGYKAVEVVWEGTPLNILLEEDTQLLNEVVVTALGISREKKSLGYAVQDVKADELTRAANATLTDALQGKVAGLMINTSGTGAGGSSKVTIRGNSSLSDNNAPLWVVDGIPFDSQGSSDGGANLWGGKDTAGGAFDINPEDIESVSVLKGPTAAALYGSRAGNGVILITTKKGGKADGRWGISYSGKATVSPIAYSLDLQNEFGQGVDGKYANSEYSWGGRMDGSVIPAWWDASKNTKYSVQADPMKAFYRTGVSQSHNVTLSGGKKENPFRLSVGYDTLEGASKNNNVNKTSIDLVNKLVVNDMLDFDVKANYIHTVGNNRPNLGMYGTAYTLYNTPRNIQIADLEKYLYDPNQPGAYVQQNWWTVNPNKQNPYWILNQEHNRDTKDRLFGMIGANFKFNEHLVLKVKQGLDYAGTEDKTWYPYNDISFTARPSMEIWRNGNRELNTEGLLSYSNSFGEDIDFGASIGGNIMNNKREGIRAYGRNFPLMGAQYVGLGSVQEASNTVWEKQINSVYAFANFGYKNYLFVDVTARNDWSSTLPAGNRSYFYPSVSVSGLITGALDAYGVSYNKEAIDYGKVRFSIAQVGKDTDPYQLLNSYGTTTDAFGLLYGYIDDNFTLANANLKPEIATSYEVGTEWHFFKNRLGIDLTYYNTKTKNQVMSLSKVQTSGYRNVYENVGQITNSGIEAMINADFIRKRDFTLSGTLNLAHNSSMVDELAEGIDMYSLGKLTGLAGEFQVIAQKGEKLGQLYDYGFRRDKDGKIVVNEDGLPLTSESKKVLGDIQPDLTGSFNLNAQYKGFAASALFAFQVGGDIFSATEYAAAKVGTAARTAKDGRKDFVVAGVTESGAANTKAVSAEKYWTSPIVEDFIYDASFLKLQEVSLSYTFGADAIKGLDHLKVALFGNNLFYFLKNTPGTTPDGSALSSSLFASAIDLTPLPNTRTFGISLNFGF